MQLNLRGLFFLNVNQARRKKGMPSLACLACHNHILIARSHREFLQVDLFVARGPLAQLYVGEATS